MPATISVNFATQAVANAGTSTNTSINPATLAGVLANAGGTGSGYVTIAGAQTITGTKTFSASIAANAGINIANGQTLSIGGIDRLYGGVNDPQLNARILQNNSSTLADGMWINYNSTGTTNGHCRIFANGTNQRMIVRADTGRVGINTNNPAATLEVNGDIRVTGNSTGIIPVGAVMGFFANAAPAGWLVLNGAILNRSGASGFPDLWAYAQASGNLVNEANWIAGRYGSFSTGDTLNTFRIPLTLGMFLRGWSNGTTWDSGRVIGSYQADGIKDHRHSGCTGTESADHTHGYISKGGNGASGVDQWSGIPGKLGNNVATGNASARHYHCFTTTDALAGATADTRPQNVPILWCIKW